MAVYGTRGGENTGGGATYAAAKAALIALTKGIAHEGSPYVTANIVVPGPTNPEPRSNRVEDPPVAEDGSVRWLGMKYLSGRMGVAEDVANATAFFTSKAVCSASSIELILLPGCYCDLDALFGERYRCF